MNVYSVFQIYWLKMWVSRNSSWTVSILGTRCLLPLLFALLRYLLVLDCNIHFSFQGAKALSNMLKKNKSIRILQFSNNAIEYSVSISIHKDMHLNIYGKINHHIMITPLKGCKTFYLCFSLKQGFASIAEALLENNTIRSLYLKLVTHNLVALMWFILNV